LNGTYLGELWLLGNCYLSLCVCQT